MCDIVTVAQDGTCVATTNDSNPAPDFFVAAAVFISVVWVVLWCAVGVPLFNGLLQSLGAWKGRENSSDSCVQDLCCGLFTTFAVLVTLPIGVPCLIITEIVSLLLCPHRQVTLTLILTPTLTITQTLTLGCFKTQLENDFGSRYENLKQARLLFKSGC